MPMTPLPTGTVRQTSNLFVVEIEQKVEPWLRLIYPTEYIWAGIQPSGSSLGIMKQVRPVTNLVYITQGGIGLINQAPNEGQIWPRGNAEIRD